VGSSPQFSPSVLLVQTLLWCLYSPHVQSHALTAVQTLKIPGTASYTIVRNTKLLHTLRAMGSTALVAAVPYPAKVTQIPPEGQWTRTFCGEYFFVSCGWVKCNHWDGVTFLWVVGGWNTEMVVIADWLNLVMIVTDFIFNCNVVCVELWIWLLFVILHVTVIWLLWLIRH